MKKKILVILICVNILIPIHCFGADESKNKSSWGENSSVFSSGFEGQKPVTDSSFQKTLKMLKERSLTKKQKKMQKEIKPFSPAADEEYLKNFVQDETNEFGAAKAHTIMIPLNVYTSDGIDIPVGYYRLSARQLSKDEYVLDLSQGNDKTYSIKARQTKQDLEQETLSFGNAEIIDEHRIRLIYGSIDLNLVGYLYY